MASDLVSVGTLPNDGTGTALRDVVTAFNGNFSRLDDGLAGILSSLIAGMVVNGSGHLIVTYADSVSADLGNVTGPVGVASAAVNVSGRLILTRSNGTTIDAGSVIGPTGRGIASATVDGSRHLILTYTDGATVDAGFVGAGVTSFNGRQNAVTSQAGDYTATQITGLASRSHFLALTF